MGFPSRQLRGITTAENGFDVIMESLSDPFTRSRHGRMIARLSQASLFTVTSPKMPMTLQGSCQCGAVEFTVESHTPVAYVGKSGGYNGSCNLGGIANSLKMTKGLSEIKYVVLFCQSIGLDILSGTSPTNFESSQEVHSYKGSRQTHGRNMYLSTLFLRQLLHHAMALGYDLGRPDPPLHSAIDTELPVPDELVCVRGDSKPKYVRWPEGKKEVQDGFGEESIESWHKKHGFWVE
jgi:hypothetical protein